MLSYRERILDDVAMLYRHWISTDPGIFHVLVDPATNKIAGFGIGYVRLPSFMFFGFIFVLPEYQGGVGRRIYQKLLESRPPNAPVVLTADTAQPVSNSLYAQFGCVGRVVIQNMKGALDLAKIGAQSTQLETVRIVVSDPKEGEITLSDAIDAMTALDKEILGYARAQDHPFLLDRRPLAVLYKENGAVIGYGYARPGGAVGPVLVARPELLKEMVFDGLVRALEAGRVGSADPDAVTVSIWLASSVQPELFGELLSAGMKIAGFPSLLCWDGGNDRPFISDLRRYQIYSPGLL